MSKAPVRRVKRDVSGDLLHVYVGVSICFLSSSHRLVIELVMMNM